MFTLYGIPNCDTVRKARKWLAENQIEYQFFDFKKQPLEQDLLEQWLDILDWETVLNKRSTTWRQLSDSSKSSIDRDSAIQIMLAQPTIIKRPVLDNGAAENDRVLCVGFKADHYQSLFHSLNKK